MPLSPAVGLIMRIRRSGQLSAAGAPSVAPRGLAACSANELTSASTKNQTVTGASLVNLDIVEEKAQDYDELFTRVLFIALIGFAMSIAAGRSSDI